MAPKGGIRKRVLASANQPPDADDLSSVAADLPPVQAASASSAGPPRRGGIRQRMAAASSAPDHVESVDSPLSDDGPARRRGIRQRMAASTPDHVDTVDRSLLYAWKKDWGAGRLSSTKVQEYAMKAIAQGTWGMEAAAAIGASGKHPQNCQRALLNLFGSPAGAPEFTWCPIRTKRGTTIHPFLLPHEWFASMHRECQEQFVSSISGPPGACAAFWKSITGTDFFQKHPALDPEHLPFTIPIGFYGDAGAFSQQDPLMVLLGSPC